MKEIWKALCEYPDYEVSNLGRVHRVYDNGTREEVEPYSDFEIIKVKLRNYQGVDEVALGYLVMNAFDPYRGPGGWSAIVYLDEDPWNCSVENMRWKKKNMREIYEKREAKYINDHKVYCYENDTVYENVSIAAKELDIDRSRVSRCCNGAVETVSGYHLSFLKNKKNLIDKMKDKQKSKKVYCYENDTVYENATIAANELGLDRTRISRCCISDGGFTGGYHFSFVTDKKESIQNNDKNNRGQKVYCKSLIDGSIRIFTNQSEAIAELNLPSIKNVLAGRQKSAGNYIFSYDKEDVL